MQEECKFFTKWVEEVKVCYNVTWFDDYLDCEINCFDCNKKIRFGDKVEINCILCSGEHYTVCGECNETKKTTRKMVIWDLFGGGQNSVYKTLKEFDLLNEYEIYTFDITPPQHDNQYCLDLSQDINVVIKELEKFPRPHIITSSPLCQSFSTVVSMKGGGTCFWKYNEDKTLLIERSKEEFEELKSGFTRKFIADKQLEIKRLGQKCIDNTIELIKHFKPKFWYIENPHKSLMWKYITLNKADWFNESPKYLNKALYGHYGFAIHKPTIFLSNIKMNLKSKKIPKMWDTFVDKDNVKWIYIVGKPEIKTRYTNGRSFMIARLNQLATNKEDFVEYGSDKKFSESGPASAIPHKLIKEILSYFKEKKYD